MFGAHRPVLHEPRLPDLLITAGPPPTGRQDQARPVARCPPESEANHHRPISFLQGYGAGGSDQKRPVDQAPHANRRPTNVYTTYSHRIVVAALKTLVLVSIGRRRDAGVSAGRL
jgi:hypothetical protein